MDTQKFGQTIDEKSADTMVEARQIASVVLDHGISQEQIIRIIKLLGLELENHENMKIIVSAARSIEESETSQNIII